MLLDLYIYPHPILLQIAAPVVTFDDELAELAANMAETMYEGAGVGLAAPQIGKSIQMFVVDSSTPDEPATLKTYINPKIILKETPILWNEGCLSLPGLYRDVKSFDHVIIEAQDLHGNTFREEAKSLRAVALFHENAHLLGHVFLDRLTPLKQRMARKFWAKHLRREAEETYADSKLHCIFADDKA